MTYNRIRPVFCGAWQPGIEAWPGDVIVDGGWTMIALRRTFDRPAPQPSGEPFWVGYPTPPTFSTGSETENLLITGQRYTWGEGGYSVRAKLWTPVVLSSITYELLAVDPATGVWTVVIPEQPGTVVGGTIEAALGHVITFPGSVFDFWLVTRSKAGANSWGADWDYKRTNGTPSGSAGECWHSNNGRTITFNEVDNGDVDQSANLALMQPGDQIAAGGQTWNILDVITGGDTVGFDVEPSSRLSSEGVRTFSFTYYTAAPITYDFITDHFLANANVQGLKSTSGQSGIVLDQNGYGVDIEVEPAIVSDDFDVWSLSG